MFEISHILFPTNGTSECQALVPQVVAVANHFGAKVTLLHGAEEGHDSSIADLFGEWSDSGVFEYVRTTDPLAGKIMEMGRSGRFDLLMIPTRGQGALRRLFSPSLVEQLVPDYPGPIWTARGKALELRRIRRVVCVLDLGPRSQFTLQSAMEVCLEWNAQLSIVHAIPDLDEGLLQLAAGRELPATLSPEVADQEIARLQREVGARATVYIESGDAVGAVSYRVRQLRADLLVTQSGRDTANLVRSVECPVLVLGKGQRASRRKHIGEDAVGVTALLGSGAT